MKKSKHPEYRDHLLVFQTRAYDARGALATPTCLLVVEVIYSLPNVLGKIVSKKSKALQT